jgi:hypothetical protein
MEIDFLIFHLAVLLIAFSKCLSEFQFPVIRFSWGLNQVSIYKMQIEIWLVDIRKIKMWTYQANFQHLLLLATFPVVGVHWCRGHLNGSKIKA